VAIKCIMKKNLSRLPDLLSKEISILRVLYSVELSYVHSAYLI